MVEDAQLQVLVNQDTPRSESESVQAYLKGTKRGEACVIDFYTEMMLEGRAFQMRAGSVTTPLVGDAVIIDTKAEMAVEAPNGLAVLPVYCNIAINLGAGTLHEYCLNSVDGAITTIGTAFVPLSLIMDSNAKSSMVSRCAVAAEGGVTVVADAVTTTRSHWHVANPLAVAAGHGITTHEWQPRVPPVVANTAHAYVQIAATTTGPSYFANVDWIELPWSSIS